MRLRGAVSSATGAGGPEHAAAGAAEIS
jgi:hypothetical protein